MSADTLLTGVAIVEVNFHVFVRAGKDERVTYAGCGALREEQWAIMDLVKEEAKKIAGMVQKIDPGTFVTSVYKVQFPNNCLRFISLKITAERAANADFPGGFRIQGEILEGVRCGPFRGFS